MGCSLFKYPHIRCIFSVSLHIIIQPPPHRSFISLTTHDVMLACCVYSSHTVYISSFCVLYTSRCTPTSLPLVCTSTKLLRLLHNMGRARKSRSPCGHSLSQRSLSPSPHLVDWCLVMLRFHTHFSFLKLQIPALLPRLSPYLHTHFCDAYPLRRRR